MSNDVRVVKREHIKVTVNPEKHQDLTKTQSIEAKRSSLNEKLFYRSVNRYNYFSICFTIIKNSS